MDFSFSLPYYNIVVKGNCCTGAPAPAPVQKRLQPQGWSLKGVTVKNAIFRDGIYAEQIAIARAVTAGYKYGDFEEILIMVSMLNVDN